MNRITITQPGVVESSDGTKSCPHQLQGDLDGGQNSGTSVLLVAGFLHGSKQVTACLVKIMEKQRLHLADTLKLDKT